MITCPQCGRESTEGDRRCACGAQLPAKAPEPDEPVVVRSFDTEAVALLALQAMEEAGILCQLVTDDCGGMLPPLAQSKGIRLTVPAKDAAQAREVLSGLASFPASDSGVD